MLLHDAFEFVSGTRSATRNNMSSGTPRSVRHLAVELARFARLGLHCAVLVVMALLLNTTPGLGVRNCVESEAPFYTYYL